MFRSRLNIATLLLTRHSLNKLNKRSTTAKTLSPSEISEILFKDETNLPRNALPNCIKSIECNQLASNKPIEDRLRVSSFRVPDCSEPTLIFGVFDGHGGVTTADIISRRLFNYIAVSLYTQQDSLKTADSNQIIDLHNSPQRINHTLNSNEWELLIRHKDELSKSANIATRLKESFKRCDDDLSKEIHGNLLHTNRNQDIINHYISAFCSGCCALIMVVHEGMAYLASAGDCRAVLGTQEGMNDKSNPTRSVQDVKYNAVDLNDEHNFYNKNETNRLKKLHPKEERTMFKQRRLLGNLQPFRAFGDFIYKWPREMIEDLSPYGILPPGDYLTPPYLIAEPDVNEFKIKDSSDVTSDHDQRFIVLASDGLWDFLGSRDVVGAVVDHSTKANIEGDQQIYDKNCATHILRYALRSSYPDDCLKNEEELRSLYDTRLSTLLTMPQAEVRFYRDDISIVVIKL